MLNNNVGATSSRQGYDKVSLDRRLRSYLKLLLHGLCGG